MRARVLDAEGRAVRGIVVSTIDARAQPIDRIGRTDPRGLVESWGGAHSWRLRTREGDLILRAETLFEPSIEVEAPRDGSTVALRAPPSGSVRILVPDAGPARVRLRRAQRQGEVLDDVRDGVATFDLVPLGERLEAWVFGPLEAHGPHEFDGPTRAGEVVEFELPRASRAVRVTATLVDERGVPMAHRPVHVELDMKDPIRAVYAVTDARGRFAFLAHPDHRVHLRAIDAPGPDGRRDVRHAVVEAVGQRAIDGAVELGALPLLAPPVLARGRVVDDVGRPIEGATVSASDGSYPPIADDVTRADGSFVLRGSAAPRWRLVTWIEGYRAPDGRLGVEGERGGEVVFGGDGIVVRLEPTSSVRTRLLVPREHDRGAFYLTVEDARGKLVRMHDPWIDPGIVNGMPFGGSAAEGLAPGPARLAIHS